MIELKLHCGRVKFKPKSGANDGNYYLKTEKTVSERLLYTSSHSFVPIYSLELISIMWLYDAGHIPKAGHQFDMFALLHEND